MDKRLERILPRVQKPARYVGGEYNAILKDKAAVDTRIAFCFPDTYEIGMSNLGMRILYGVMNNIPGVWCERVFAPWGDMEAELRQADMPLFALESGDPITDYDIVAFSVGYEMAFPAILNMLDLAHIPLHAADRTGLTPLVIAGGTAMYNAEPLADFIDLVSLGEGEDVTVELVELHRRARREGWSKADFLRAAARLDGIYVPSLYDVTYHDDGTVASITPRAGAPAVVTKRIDPDKNNQVSYKVPASGLKNKETVSVFRADYRFDKLRDGLPTFALHAAGRYEDSETVHYEGDGYNRSYTRIAGSVEASKFFSFGRNRITATLGVRGAAPITSSQHVQERIKQAYTDPAFEYITATWIGGNAAVRYRRLFGKLWAGL